MVLIASLSRDLRRKRRAHRSNELLEHDRLSQHACRNEPVVIDRRARDDHHWNVSRLCIRRDFRAYRVAIERRQQKIQNNDIRRILVEHVKGFKTVSRAASKKPRERQRFAEQVA